MVPRVLVKFTYWKVLKSSLHKNVQFDTKLTRLLGQLLQTDQIIIGRDGRFAYIAAMRFFNPRF